MRKKYCFFSSKRSVFSLTLCYEDEELLPGFFFNPQLFLSGYGFRLHASGEFGSESGYFLIRSLGIRYVWTGKFLNPEKKLRIQRYPDTCGRGLTCDILE